MYLPGTFDGGDPMGTPCRAPHCDGISCALVQKKEPLKMPVREISTPGTVWAVG